MSFIKKFHEIGLADVPSVGGKNASTGELMRNLSPLGISVPDGFVVTADAFTELIEEGDLFPIYELLSETDISDVRALAHTGITIRERIKKAGLPRSVSEEIKLAYAEMCSADGDVTSVSVRSSATAEDLPEASFAGQQETFLNVQGEAAVLEACVNCFASLFTDRAISYRDSHGFDHRKVRLSVGIQKMVRSDLAASGVIFTLDTESGADNVILITSAYGLGENIVGGKVNPDEFLISKPLLADSACPILRHRLGAKQSALVYDSHGTRRTKNVDVSETRRDEYSLTDKEILELARWSRSIEEHYSKVHGRQTPMDLEWAKDGLSGKLYILQARPETVHSRQTGTREIMSLLETSKILLTGKAVGTKIGAGRVHIINDRSELSTFRKGEVLVTDMTDPDWEPVMKLASAIITNRGGRTCHAAIVGREHGVPCIVGTGTGTRDLRNGQLVTASCSEGEKGRVYEGELRFSSRTVRSELQKRPGTKIMVNLADPDEALKASRLPVDGVGLARMEFMITHQLRVHPMALIHPELLDEKDRREIHELSRRFKTGEEFFVHSLAEGIATIAGAFYPRPVILRFSDFKTNEYAGLLGGQKFEPYEENPMIGFRGASRYYSPQYREGFGLECKAIRRVRETIGLRNLKVMVPFCRTPTEARHVLDEMRKNGLERGKEGLEVYMMCEIPSNVLDMDSFAEHFDGFSIGSNDLTQMTLGVDRDSALVSHLFDEREPAALTMMGLAVTGAKRLLKPVGICGQAPSDYPKVCRFLVEKGIDSISLSVDTVFQGIEVINDAESGRDAQESRPH